ncbi:hypothetical protein B0I37DRAFT_378201 [Chaetomium sp. MPI-CAGE-AT-0009]|nr:hypothetical protein B0I37DRAFT_378201 [Chaetomium sp. MPI-CAGE-AT-0009]
MDPVTAISLVSGIISFVTFAKDLVKGALKIHESQDGYSKENQNREFVADEMRRFGAILQPPGEPGLAGEDKGLASLAAKCHELAEDMAKMLDKTKAKDPTSRTQSVWATLKAKVNERDLMDFERRLDQCATQMHLQLTFFTSRNTAATLNRLIASASSNASALEKLTINANQLRQSVGTTNKELTEQLCQIMQLLGKAVDATIQRRILNSLCFEEMTRRFEMVEEAHLDTFKWMFDASAFVYDAPLKSLRSLFGEPGLDGDPDNSCNSDCDSEVESDDQENDEEGERDEKMEDENDKHEDRYEGNEKACSPAMVPRLESSYGGLTWQSIRARRSIRAKRAAGRGFIKWLSSSHGIFHISGKMGSGKSTMMRLLYEHPATKYELNRWAGTRIPVFANFFFWKPGSKLQKNLAGLLRALLHATLKTCQELIPEVMPEHWKQMQAQPWHNQSAVQISNKEIRDALVRLVQNPGIHNKYRFCFFIDGLDEYEGTIQEDQRHLVDFLLRWTKASRGNLKVCVSSREHNIFMNAFQADKRIRLHEFTEHDMELYTHDKLKHIPNAITREFLVREISSRARGIFLWVTLVVKTVREQLEHDATQDELTTLLGSIPDELDDLFKHLFLSISKVNARRACQVFTLLLTGMRHGIRLYLYGLSFLEEYEKNNRFAFLETAHKLEKARREAKVAHTRKQLNTWCKGLVEAVHRPEVRPTRNEYDLEYQVDFTHRSIYDFLELNTTMVDADWQATLRGFDAVDALSHISCATHKPTPTITPRLFPVGEIISMRLGNGLDRAPFEYLEHLANRYRYHDTFRYRPVDDCVISLVNVLHRDGVYTTVASRRFLPSEKVDVYNNSADEMSCSFGILLQAIREGHVGYLKWKIDNDPSSIDNPHEAVLLTNAFLDSTVNHELSHPTASSSILALLFNNNLISPDSVSFWAPGDSAHPSVSPSKSLINLELSVWQWYLFRITCCFAGLRAMFRHLPPFPAQQQFQIGKALEAFLDYGADPHFTLSVSAIQNVQRGSHGYSFQLGFEFGRKRVRVSVISSVLMGTKPGFFGRLPLNKDVRLTFQEWIETLEFPNQDRLISLLKKNKRLEEEQLAQEATRERITHDAPTSRNLASEGNKPFNTGMTDEPVKPNREGAVAAFTHISGLYAQVTLLASGILMALVVQLLWEKESR